MADPTLKELLAKKKEIDAEIEKARKEAQRGIKRAILILLKEADLTLHEVFPELGEAEPKAKAAKPRKAKAAPRKRAKGTPKYFVDGKPVDGRAATQDPRFDSVRTNGKIDDKKAAKAGMINPKWIEEQPAWVLKKLGIKGK